MGPAGRGRLHDRRRPLGARTSTPGANCGGTPRRWRPRWRRRKTELRGRPELHGDLGLPSGIVRALRHGAARPHAASVRFIRFDFHLTPNGWRISEANTDVPGGLNEASGLPTIVGPYFPGTQPAGDVAGAYADAVLAGLPHAARMALVHATAYTDDRQVMAYLARRLEALGARPSLVSPMHLQWRDGRAVMQRDAASGAVDAIVRFYPTEWMPDLPRACGWLSSLATTMTPVSNRADRDPDAEQALSVDVGRAADADAHVARVAAEDLRSTRCRVAGLRSLGGEAGARSSGGGHPHRRRDACARRRPYRAGGAPPAVRLGRAGTIRRDAAARSAAPSAIRVLVSTP